MLPAGPIAAVLEVQESSAAAWTIAETRRGEQGTAIVDQDVDLILWPESSLPNAVEEGGLRSDVRMPPLALSPCARRSWPHSGSAPRLPGRRNRGR